MWSTMASNPLLAAALTGIGAWRLLNLHPIRGDHALILISGCPVLLYLHFQSIQLSISVSIAFFMSVVFTTIAYRLSPVHPLATYPGPIFWRVTSMVLAGVSSGGHRHLILHDLHKKYGDFVRIGPNVLSINSSQAIAVIYGPKMLKGDAYTSPGRTGDISLFFKQDVTVHAKRKVLWTSALSNSAIREYYSPMTKRITQLIQCIEDRSDKSGEVDLGECITHWSFDVMGDVIFGGCTADLELMRDGDPAELVQIGKRSETGLDILGQIPWLMDIMWHFSESDTVNLRRLREVCGTMMRTRLQHRDIDKRDFTSYFINHATEKPTLTDLELEALVAVSGGSDNPSSQLIMAMFLLIAHPSVYRTLQAELDDALAHETDLLDAKALAVPFLDAVINETFRFSSPWFLPRVVPEGGVVIDGRQIPGGTIVALASHSQHFSEDNFFPDTESYRPERWLPGGLGPSSRLNKSAITTFTTGPHACPGKSFSIQQMRHLIARLVLSFDFTLAPGLSSEIFMKSFKNIRTTTFMPLIVKAAARERVLQLPC
ncbi:cytochrome P450 [Mycena polygramma]|nr:cytochrome P450 [Mycena polygramma]